MSGIHSALSFVDKATPQQLKGMLDDPANPYRALALMKLQEFRNAKMQAVQPPAPPLSQTIPQQVEGGIPAAMPQAAPQPQGQPSFKDGGDVKRYAGEDESFIRNPGVDYAEPENRVLGIPLSGLKKYFSIAPPDDAAIKMRDAYRGTGKSSPPVWSNPTPQGFGDAADAKRMGRDKFEADVPTVGAIPGGVAQIPDAAPAKTASGVTPGGIGNLPKDMPGFGKARGVIEDAFKGIATGREGERQAMLEAMNARSGDAAGRQKALGTEEDRKAAVAAQMKELDTLLPDSNKRIAAEIEKMRADTEKDSANAPYQGLLKMAVSMMSTNKSNFLQAVGEAGGAGLEEFNKMKTAVNARKASLLTADANLAAAQEARQRGMYDQANKLVESATQKRMDAWNFERDASVLKGQMAIQMAAHKTGDSEAKVKEAQTLFAIDQAGMDYKLKLQQLAQSGSAAAAAMIPAAAKEIMWLKAHPEMAAEFQTRSDHMTYLSLVDDAMKSLTSRQASAERNGIMPGSPEYPTPDKVRKEIIDNVTQGRNTFRATSRPEIK
jgi:hypothetical protein